MKRCNCFLQLTLAHETTAQYLSHTSFMHRFSTYVYYKNWWTSGSESKRERYSNSFYVIKQTFYEDKDQKQGRMGICF